MMSTEIALGADESRGLTDDVVEKLEQLIFGVWNNPSGEGARSHFESGRAL